MAVLRKRNTKKGHVYDIDFTFEGKRQIISTKTSEKRVALQILADIQNKISRGTFNLLEYEKKNITLKAFMDAYLTYAQSYKEKSTMELERTYINGFVHYIGEKKAMRSIDASLLDQWKSQFSPKVSPATFNIVWRILHASFQVALKWAYIESNPFKLIQKLKVPERRLFLLDEEISQIFKMINSDINKPDLRLNVSRFRQRFKLYVEFLLNTGLRREEALRLTPENIDWSRNVIFIQRTKTKQMRTIPLNKRAREILGGLGDELFSKLNKQDVSNKFREYLNRAGLKGFKLHSLRHTFSCRLLAAGVDLYTISRLLGHTDIKTTMIYAKTNVELLKTAVDKLDAGERKYLNGEMPTTVVPNPSPK